jgi:hypothetical protein
MNANFKKFHNPKLQILSFAFFLLILQNYTFSEIVHYYLPYIDNNFLYLIFTITPFAFRSLVRPFGGIIFGFWQIKSKYWILPILLIIYSILGLLVDFLTKYLYIEHFNLIILGIKILQGLIIGGIIPQLLIYFYENSDNLSQKVLYSSGIFITFIIAVVFTTFNTTFIPKEALYWVNICIDLIFIMLTIKIFNSRHSWSNFSLENLPSSVSSSLWITIKTNYAPIIRFIMVLSFIASLESFFFTVMPFYLIYFLHYRTPEVFVLIMFSCGSGVIGLILGIYYHAIIGKKQHLALGIVIKIMLYILFMVYIHHNLLLTKIFSSICMLCVGLMLAKMPLILNSILPAKTRIYGFSIIYNMSIGLMFGFSGFIVILLLNHFHNLYIPSMFILFFSYMSLISLWFTPNKDFYRYLDIN